MSIKKQHKFSKTTVLTAEDTYIEDKGLVMTSKFVFGMRCYLVKSFLSWCERIWDLWFQDISTFDIFASVAGLGDERGTGWSMGPKYQLIFMSHKSTSSSTRSRGKPSLRNFQFWSSEKTFSSFSIRQLYRNSVDFLWGTHFNRLNADKIAEWGTRFSGQEKKRMSFRNTVLVGKSSLI